jgi:ferredoxin
MLANYGYADASGDYYITIDTDKCNGCGECAQICPKDIFEMVLDDYDEKVPIVREEVCRQLGHECEAEVCGYKCQEICEEKAITHSW